MNSLCWGLCHLVFVVCLICQILHRGSCKLHIWQSTDVTTSLSAFLQSWQKYHIHNLNFCNAERVTKSSFSATAEECTNAAKIWINPSLWSLVTTAPQDLIYREWGVHFCQCYSDLIYRAHCHSHKYAWSCLDKTKISAALVITRLSQQWMKCFRETWFSCSVRKLVHCTL